MLNRWWLPKGTPADYLVSLSSIDLEGVEPRTPCFFLPRTFCNLKEVRPRTFGNLKEVGPRTFCNLGEVERLNYA